MGHHDHDREPYHPYGVATAITFIGLICDGAFPSL